MTNAMYMKKMIRRMARAVVRVLSFLGRSNAWKDLLRVVTYLSTITNIKD